MLSSTEASLPQVLGSEPGPKMGHPSGPGMPCRTELSSRSWASLRLETPFNTLQAAAALNLCFFRVEKYF